MFSADTSDNPADLLEMDTAPRAAAPDAPCDVLELDIEPREPDWLRDARRAIVAAEDHGALNMVVSHFMRFPEDRKIQLRPILAAHRAELDRRRIDLAKAAKRAEAPACGVAPAEIAAPPPQAPATSAPAEMATSGDGRPMTARWREIKMADSPFNGQWGIAVEHVQYGAAIDPPRVDDIVIVYRAHGGGAQRKRVQAVVRIDHEKGYSLCAVSDAPAGVQATIARPKRVAPVAPTRLVQLDNLPLPNQVLVTPVTPETAPSPSSLVTLASALNGVATEAASNAAVADLGAQGASSESSAQGRRLAVGFSTWQQYAEALRRGGLQPHTHAEYLAHVRAHMSPDEIAALPAPNGTSQALPVGPGIVHTPVGKTYADMSKEERKGLMRVGKSDAQLTGTALMRRGDVIGGACLAGAGVMVGWEGANVIKRGKLVEVLATIQRADDAPAAKDAQVQLSRACRTLNSGRYDVRAVAGEDVPEGITARYIVMDRDSMPDGSEVIATGAPAEARVTVVLTVDLLEDGTIRYYGQTELADKIRADYQARTSEQTFTSADITTWLQGILATRHGATRYGLHWYIPGGQREKAIELIKAVKSTHWGTRWITGCTLTTEAALIEGLADSLMDEIALVERDWAKARAHAAAEYAKVDDTGKRKRQTEDLTSRGAATYFRRLTIVSERVRGYGELLGEAALAAHRARIAKLDAEIRMLCDDTTIRGALLEFS